MKNKKEKILFFDIETSYNVARTFTVKSKTYLSHNSIKDWGKIICITWAWNKESKIHCAHWGLNTQNDKKLLLQFAKVFNKADFAVAHNGDRFDIKWLNARYLYHELPRLSTVPTVDTLKLAKQQFYLPSYRLDFLGRYLNLGRKNEMEFEDWVKVIENKSNIHLNKMIKYAKQDTALLRKLYYRLAPHSIHPVHRGLIVNRPKNTSCPNCGSLNTSQNGIRVSRRARYQRYRCVNCGASWQGETI